MKGSSCRPPCRAGHGHAEDADGCRVRERHAVLTSVLRQLATPVGARVILGTTAAATDNRFNIDMSIRREFALPNALRLELGADAMNILNNTQFSGTYTGALGNTVTNANPALGLVPGMGNSNQYGTRGMNTYNPRQIMLRATLRF